MNVFFIAREAVHLVNCSFSETAETCVLELHVYIHDFIYENTRLSEKEITYNL